MSRHQGKVAIVTGGNSDIGRETVRLLALNGAKVYFTVRSEAKGTETQRLIQELSPGIPLGRIPWVKMDLENMSSITAAADSIKRMERKIDILINNAAAATSSNTPTSTGWEPHMAVNLVGPFAFTNQIIPLLKSALKEADHDVRIVTLTSNAQVAMLPRNYKFPFTSDTFLSNPVRAHPWQWRYFGKFMFGFDMIRYSVSKAANLIFARELQRRMDDQELPILSIAVHPGEVATSGVFTINNAMLGMVARLTFLSPEEGAATPVFAAVAEEVRDEFSKYREGFMMPGGKVGEASPVVLDEEQVRGLWQTTTAEVNRQMAAEGLPALQPW